MPDFVQHTIGPVYDTSSKILILGTMPSPKSREYGFYYSHPQNRFWRVLAELLQTPIPSSNEEKRVLCLSHHIALWDVLQSCSIEGADDASIREPVANDISGLLQKTGIRRVFTTGTKAAALYKRLCFPSTQLAAVALPSTSPANCRHYSYPDLVGAYRVILEYL